ncbi:MAG: hypothetical protein H0T77_13165 [Pyrinomonadaceae bacterium]|nr:hypothetical protein [Pyrinomonadaceae bacterium]
MFQTTLLINPTSFSLQENDTGLKSSMGKVGCGSFKYMAFKDLIAKQLPQKSNLLPYIPI